MSREIARIQIVGQRERLQNIWNASHPNHQMIAGAVEIDVHTPQYEQLRQLFAVERAQSVLDWQEHRTVTYEPEDLARCELLTLWVSGEAGPGGNTYARVYATHATCPKCHSERLQQQVAPLRLNPARLEPHDFVATDHFEWLCSTRAKDILQSVSAEVSFQPVEWTEQTFVDPYYQLHITPKFGPLSAQMPITRERVCDSCGEFAAIGIAASGVSREVRLPKSSYHGETIALTLEQFGAERKFSLIMISNALWRAFRAAGLSGWWAEPAHLVD